jgi:hypothetical protein
MAASIQKPLEHSAPADASGETQPLVRSFTRLDIPQVEVFETAVTFEAKCDPISAHEELKGVFGQKAGSGSFLFRADSSVPGRYWVRSAQPWTGRPAKAIAALAPKRMIIQLASGLMYHFMLPVCAGHEFYEGEQRVLHPYRTEAEVESWFASHAAGYGIKPLMYSASLRSLRFRYEGVAYRIDHAVLEGALEVEEPDRLRQQLLRGFGWHRRAGLGMLYMYN